MSEGGETTTTGPRLQPVLSSSPLDATTSATATTTDTLDNIPPYAPQHHLILLQEDPSSSSCAPLLPEDNGIIRETSSTSATAESTPQKEKAKNLTRKTLVERGSVEESFAFISAVFGMDIPPLPVKDDLNDSAVLGSMRTANSSSFSSTKNATTATSTSANINATTTGAAVAVRKSSPIKMKSSSVSLGDEIGRDSHLLITDDSENGDQKNNINKNRPGSPVHRSLSDCEHASDFHDPKDGHMWRAKYCVLEAGVLYFYRSQADAESPEAQQERLFQEELEGIAAAATTTATFQQQQEQQLKLPPNDPLAHSPIPFRFKQIIELEMKNSTTNSQTGFLWEKRVALDCVGAVRSAETEYGKNSFELSAVDEYDDDKLILRAQSADEMNEWLFQFHRSIATFVLDIMDQVNPELGDIHHPTFAHKRMLAASVDQTSPKRNSSTAMISYSPRFHKTTTSGTATPASLSHGHGRHSMHRRRVIDSSSSSKRSQRDHPDSPLQVPSVDTRALTETPIVTPSPNLPPSPQEHFPMDSSPELSAPQSACPEMERPTPSMTYIPPHARNREESVVDQTNSTSRVRSKKKGAYVPPHLRKKQEHDKYVPRYVREGRKLAPIGLSLQERVSALDSASASSFDSDDRASSAEENIIEEGKDDGNDSKSIKLGGCADPYVVQGSILDAAFIPRKSSRVGKVQTNPYGYTTGIDGGTAGLRWEIGAVSECGVRDSNEDSYLIVSETIDCFLSGGSQSFAWGNRNHSPGLFAIFDGHCGNEAARFAAEKLTTFIKVESVRQSDERNMENETDLVGQILERAIASMDDAFCDLCVDDGRAWDSGATALIATVVDHHLVIANLGDARGVMSRSVMDVEGRTTLDVGGWNELPFDDHMGSRRCFWQELTQAHSPSREDECARIHKANGWVTTEKEIPIGQLKRMVLEDQDVVDILKRCFADRFHPSPKAAAPQRILQISRLCGELAVSRALGDRDFKASYNRRNSNDEDASNQSEVDDEETWDCPLYLPYPDDHSRSFVGDLVSNKPEFQTIRVGEEGASDEFLLLACDGLWDVIDSDDAVRVTRDLLFEKQWPAKKAAARLAELAIHLGSSDNITVIVVRFFRGESERR